MLSKNLAIMFTDMKGFTSRTSQQTRAENEQMLRQHQQLLEPIVKEHNGVIIKSIGDSFLITYESCTNAVLAAMAMQDCLKKYNMDSPTKDHIEVRIAISAGDVRIENNDVFGEAVNIASRLENIIEANEICFTDSVFLLMNRQEVPFQEVGWKELEGIPYKVRIFRVRQEETSRKNTAGMLSAGMDDEEFLAQLAAASPQKMSLGEALEDVLQEFYPLVAGRHIQLQIWPPREPIPLVNVNKEMLNKAIMALLRFALCTLLPKGGRLQVKFSPSGFRTADLTFMRTLPQRLSPQHIYSENDALSVGRGNRAVKLELSFTDFTVYDDDATFFNRWEDLYLKREQGLNLSFLAIYKIIHTYRGTVRFEASADMRSSFVLKFPPA